VHGKGLDFILQGALVYLSKVFVASPLIILVLPK